LVKRDLVVHLIQIVGRNGWYRGARREETREREPNTFDADHKILLRHLPDNLAAGIQQG
jgi:hypothetical protein